MRTGLAYGPWTTPRTCARTLLAEVVPTPGGVFLRASADAERAGAIVLTAYVEAVAAEHVRTEAEHHVVRLTAQRACVASGGRREVAVPPRGALIRVRFGVGLGWGWDCSPLCATVMR